MKSARFLAAIVVLVSGLAFGAESIPVAEKIITAADLTVEKVGSSIPVSAIGEPVGAVTLSPPRWVDDANGGYGAVDGQILPVDPGSKPINFRVALPARWALRGLQLGGGGMNGNIPPVTGPDLARGFATYGSDSGHQGGDGDWALNDEAIKNLGYMQMKKTHDAAMVLIERVYGERPRFNYYIGSRRADARR